MAHRVWGIHSVCGVRARARARGGGCASVGGTRAHACTVPVRVESWAGKRGGGVERRRGRTAAGANGGGGGASSGRARSLISTACTSSGHKIPLKFQPSSHQSRPDSYPIQTLHRVWHYAGSGMLFNLLNGNIDANNHSPCSPAGEGEYLNSKAPSSIPDADYPPLL